MNGNLSNSQFNSQPSLTPRGAMADNPKFDGPAPIKAPNENGNAIPNKGVPLAKPGFF